MYVNERKASCMRSEEFQIPIETLSKAMLEKQSNGTLRFIRANRSGDWVIRVFNDEQKLDEYLLSSNVDIWKIIDKRSETPRKLYKHIDLDEVDTFTNKNSLFRNIASGTEYGVFGFSIGNKVKYIQEEKKWLKRSYRAISKEEAEDTILRKETSHFSWKKVYAISVIVLAAIPLMHGIGNPLWRTWTNTGKAPSTARANIFSATLFTYGMMSRSWSVQSGASLASALMILQGVRAQSCYELVGRYDTPDQAVGIAIAGNYAYVADRLSGLEIFNISNPSNLTIVGSYDPSETIMAVTVAGNYAYLVASVSGVLIVEITNPSNPTLAGFINTSGWVYGFSVQGNYAYVGYITSGYDIYIIDITTPANPIQMGSLAVDGIVRLAVSDKYVYGELDPSGFSIINVTNPSNPSLLVSWSFPTRPTSEIVVRGSYAYLTDWSSLFRIINIADPLNPFLIGFYSLGVPNSVGLLGSHAYIADGTLGLQIIDVSDPSRPTFSGSYNTTGTASDIAISGNHVYIAEAASGIEVIRLNCIPTNPTNTRVTAKTSDASPSKVHRSTSNLNSDTNTNRRAGAIAGILAGIFSSCFIVSSVAYLYYIRSKKREETHPTVDPLHLTRETPFELDPVVESPHKKIGENYYQYGKIDKNEAKEIHEQTGLTIVFPEDRERMKYGLEEGISGVVKIAKRIEDGQYVAFRKVRGYDHILTLERETNIQREAAGENVMPIYNSIKTEDSLYVVTPLAGFGTARDIQKELAEINDSKLTTEIVTYIAKDLLTGLKTMHDKGVCHLDIKPENIVLTKDGTSYITSFGCAKKLEGGHANIPFQADGDYRYFSPERLDAIRGQSFFDSKKADTWAVGLTLLEIIGNRFPNEILGLSTDRDEVLALCKQGYFEAKLHLVEEIKNPEIESVWWVIQRLLNPSPDARILVEQVLRTRCFSGLSKETQKTALLKLKTGEVL
ncbi:MAG: Serine/threonine-protein kinase StkP [Chlamydiae bacterium]|nr:Serine/threonine-protein kinase StkP [Chlamydiota bacterium]